MALIEITIYCVRENSKHDIKVPDDITGTHLIKIFYNKGIFAYTDDYGYPISLYLYELTTNEKINGKFKKITTSLKDSGVQNGDILIIQQLRMANFPVATYRNERIKVYFNLLSFPQQLKIKMFNFLSLPQQLKITIHNLIEDSEWDIQVSNTFTGEELIVWMVNKEMLAFVDDKNIPINYDLFVSCRRTGVDKKITTKSLKEEDIHNGDVLFIRSKVEGGELIKITIHNLIEDSNWDILVPDTLTGEELIRAFIIDGKLDFTDDNGDVVVYDMICADLKRWWQPIQIITSITLKEAGVKDGDLLTLINDPTFVQNFL